MSPFKCTFLPTYQEAQSCSFVNASLKLSHISIIIIIIIIITCFSMQKYISLVSETNILYWKTKMYKVLPSSAENMVDSHIARMKDK
jgi:hypothetical protein